MLLTEPVYKEKETSTASSTPCVICEVPLKHYTHNRRIPDYLCLKCYREWEHALDQPWLKHLMNKERSRRQKKQRLAKRGIYVDEVSLDQIIDSGVNPEVH